VAIHNRPIIGKLIFHSDRGVQYACHSFKNLLESNGSIIRSMSRKGDCRGNEVAKSFFSTLKNECIYQHKFKNREQAA
jgi:transposase InsO family protein